MYEEKPLDKAPLVYFFKVKNGIDYNFDINAITYDSKLGKKVSVFSLFKEDVIPSIIIRASNKHIKIYETSDINMSDKDLSLREETKERKKEAKKREKANQIAGKTKSGNSENFDANSLIGFSCANMCEYEKVKFYAIASSGIIFLIQNDGLEIPRCPASSIIHCATGKWEKSPFPPAVNMVLKQYGCGVNNDVVADENFKEKIANYDDYLEEYLKGSFRMRPISINKSDGSVVVLDS